MATNFVSKFHNLPGETVKERQQNFFKLLNENRSLKNDPKELDSIAGNLQANNHLEKIFRTDFLIYFQRFNELYEDFKKGDDITVNKLSKQAWFYQKAFGEVTCDEFVNTVLPRSSYSLKAAILKNIPLDEPRADAFFDGVSRKYGVRLATILLIKCSSTKIRDTLKEQPINLTVAQLQAIFDKDNDLIGVYFQERTKLSGKLNYKKHTRFLIYVAQKNPKVFSELFKKYHFNITLGRRTSKRYIDSQKDDIVTNKNEYFKILNKATAIRKMGAEMSDILLEVSLSDGNPYWHSVLKFYPKNRQFEVYKSTYNRLNHYKFADNISDVTMEELHIIPDAQEREELAQRIRQSNGEDEYLKYVTPELCFKEVMEKINHLSTIERTSYIEYATVCGFLNKDKSLLLKVFELVAVRLKNDEDDIRKMFIGNLEKHIDELEFLDDRHWKYFFEIIATCKANDECIYAGEIIVKCVQYLVKNNKSVTDVVRKMTDMNTFVLYTDLHKHPKSHRAFLIEVLKLGLQEYPIDPTEKKNAIAEFDCTLVYFCKIYNDKNPGNLIDIFGNPRILQSIQYILETVDKPISYYCPSGIEYAVCHHSKSLATLKTLFFSKFKKFGSVCSLMWFIKHEPTVLAKHLDTVLSNFVTLERMGNKLWKCIKKYSHLGLDTKTVEFCRQKLVEQEYQYKVYLIRALSILSPPAEHLEFIKMYNPVSDKVDLTDDDVRKLYEFQERVIKFLCLLRAPREVLEATFDFCKGDYLRFALTPLYSCFYRLPETETKEFIETLDSIKAVSVKKHATALSCVIYDKDQVKKCLKETTVPSFIFTMKYFRKNPSDDLWELVETKLNALEKNELSYLKVALNLPIPLQYKSRFIEIVWRLVDKHDSKAIKKILFWQVDKHASCNFTSQFVLNTIKDTLFQFDEALSVIANILIFSESPERFSLLSTILLKLKTYWDQPKMQGIGRWKLFNFVETLLGIYMAKENKDYRNEEFVSQLISIFSSIFTFPDAFVELVAIRFMTWKGQKFDDHARGLIALNREISETYGLYGVNLLGTFLRSLVFKYVCHKETEKIKLCHSLWKAKESSNDWLLIVALLPHEEPEREADFVLYDEILTSLEQVTDNEIRLQTNLFLKSSPSRGRNEWNFSCNQV